MSDPHLLRTEDDGIAALLSRMVGDAQEVARAEIELQKARLVVRVGEARGGIVLFVIALIAVHLALIGLVVGVLIILTYRLGPNWATVIVVGVLAVIAGISAWLGLRRFKLMSKPIGVPAKVAR